MQVHFLCTSKVKGLDGELFLGPRSRKMAAPDEDCTWTSPLNTRYASTEMRYNFSDKMKFSTWRRLWYYLAKAQKVGK